MSTLRWCWEKVLDAWYWWTEPVDVSRAVLLMFWATSIIVVQAAWHVYRQAEVDAELAATRVEECRALGPGTWYDRRSGMFCVDGAVQPYDYVELLEKAP